MIDSEPPQTMIIDAHAHLGPYSLFFIPDPDVDTMIAVMDRTGTDLAIVASNLGIQQDARSGNTETLRACSRHPGRIAAYAVINPWQDPEAELARLDGDPRMIGIKIHPMLHQYPVSGARYRPVWEYAETTGCPVLSHTSAHSATDDPGLFGPIAAEFPLARIILGHAGLSAAGVDSSIAVAQAAPNLYLEICGSSMTAQLITRMVDTVGAGRVLFGSDFPFIDQRMSLGRVIGSDLAPGVQAQILGHNAERVFEWRLNSSDRAVWNAPIRSDKIG